MNFLLGSVRSAKTTAQQTKILRLCNYQVAGLKLITGVSKDAIYRNVLSDLFELVGEDNYTYNRQNGNLTLMGAKWLVMGAHDEGSERYIRGATVGAVVGDEIVLMPQNYFKMLLSRMSPAGARFYGSTNTDSPYHWFKTDVIDNTDYVRGLGPGADLWYQTWTLDDNPTLNEQYKTFLKKSYVGVWYERFIKGRWVVAQGGIYRDVLNEDIFYTDSIRPKMLANPRRFHRSIAVDVGTSNPQVYGDFYDDGTTLYLDREYYFDSHKAGMQKTDFQYANDLMEFMSPEAKGDHQAQLRAGCNVLVDPSGASFKAELNSRGVWVTDGKNDVLDGIRRVSTMLGRKHLKINRPACPNIVREMESYAWDEDAAKHGEEKPIKSHDHGPDVVRMEVNTEVSDWRLAA